MHVLEPFASQAIDIRRIRIRISVAPNPVNIIVFAGKPKNIRLFLRQRCSRNENKQNRKNIFHIKSKSPKEEIVKHRRSMAYIETDG